MMLPQHQNSTRRLTRLPLLIGVLIALLAFWYLLPLRSIVPIPTCSLAARPRPESNANITHTTPRPHHTAILSDPSSHEPSWLLATIVGAQNQQRRNIIRTSWQRVFASPKYDFRFIIADLDNDLWTPFLQAENDTYGDLIRLDGLPEDRYTANTIKTMEFITALTTGKFPGIPPGKRYDWVSKVDDDTFLDPNAFHAEFLAQQPVNEMTLVGMLYEGWQSGRNYSYPSGRFYTLSWPLAAKLGSLYAANPIVNEHEDALVGRILYEGNQDYNFIGFPYERAPNLGDGGPNNVAFINATTYIMHNMKEDEEYLQVASLFDRRGYNGKLLSGITSYDPTFPATKRLLDLLAKWKKEAEEKEKKEAEEKEKKEAEEKEKKEAEEKEKKEAEMEQEKKKAETKQHGKETEQQETETSKKQKETSKQEQGGEQDGQGSSASQEQELRDSQRRGKR